MSLAFVVSYQPKILSQRSSVERRCVESSELELPLPPALSLSFAEGLYSARVSEIS